MRIFCEGRIMLGLLIDNKKYIKKPFLMFYLAVFVSTVSVILSLNLLDSLSSIIMITFTIIPVIPIMSKFFEDESLGKKFSDNKRMVKFYAYFFLGLIISFSFWFTFLPKQTSYRVFSEQLKQYYNLGYNKDIDPVQYQFNYGADEKYYFEKCDSKVLNEIMVKYNYDIVNCEVVFTGDKKSYLLYLASNTKYADFIYNLKKGIIYPYKYFLRMAILSNNLKLLLFIFFTSFIFGAGSFFIIAWNASIIAIYVGMFALKIYSQMSKGFFSKLLAFLLGLLYASKHILLHSLFEFAGFFLAAIAGGIISVAMLKDSRRKGVLGVFREIGPKSLVIFLFSAFLIIIAAFIETL